MLLASAERRVWESGVNDRTGALLKSEANGKVVGLLVEVDGDGAPLVPGIQVALERRHPAFRPGVPARVAIRHPVPRAPPLS